MNIEKIQDYYRETQFEYRACWNWKTNNIPALHFGYYDEKATTHDKALLRANEALAEWAGIARGARIIDAGCGVGHSSAWLAQHYNATVTGVTISPEQAAKAAELAKEKMQELDFCVANYLELPFADNTFDIVWAVESACYSTDKLAFYKEAFRVLKPGGKLVMADFIRCARPLPLPKEKLLKDVFGGWAIEELDTFEEHAAHSAKAGFADFRHRDVTKNMMTSYKNLYAHCKRYRRLGWLMNKTGLLSKVRYDNVRYSMKQLQCIQEGVTFYGHISAEKHR